jgi:hypothetical protein
VLLDELEAAPAELLGDHRSSSRRALNVVGFVQSGAAPPGSAGIVALIRPAGSVVQMVAHLGSRRFPGDK